MNNELQATIEKTISTCQPAKLDALDALAETMSKVVNWPDMNPITRADRIDAYLACAAFFHKKAEQLFPVAAEGGYLTSNLE